MPTKKQVPPPPTAYNKGDIRKMFAVVAAVSELQETPNGATLARLVERTGLDKKTVFVAIRQACFQAGMHISQTKTYYSIDDWGALSPAGADLALKGNLVGSLRQDGVEIEDVPYVRPPPSGKKRIPK
jgi:hypothetical protein